MGQVTEHESFKPVISREMTETQDNSENRSDGTDWEKRADGENDGGVREDKPEEVQSVTVHIAGAVEKPGVYSFTEGARIIEGINRAVPLKDAELAFINLAELMADQQQVIVPRKGELIEMAVSRADTGKYSSGVLTGSNRNPGRVNINTAGAMALAELPGIGPVTAQKIIDYRNEQGRFKNISEIINVSGIGEKKFAKIKEKITV